MSFVIRFAARSAAALPRNAAASSRATAMPRRAQFSAAAGLSRQDITSRVHEVLKGFERADQSVELQPTTAFGEDLGLDSLDTVEVVMAIEEEFSIEIPDTEADEIVTVGQAIDYIAKTPEAH